MQERLFAVSGGRASRAWGDDQGRGGGVAVGSGGSKSLKNESRGSDRKKWNLRQGRAKRRERREKLRHAQKLARETKEVALTNKQIGRNANAYLQEKKWKNPTYHAKNQANTGANMNKTKLN